jgi:hypothetical protein
MIPIDYDLIIFKEENTFVAYCPELDIPSCGHDIQHAKDMPKTAVRLFLEEPEKLGILENILDESKFRRDPTGRWVPPKLVATELVSAF